MKYHLQVPGTEETTDDRTLCGREVVGFLSVMELLKSCREDGYYPCKNCLRVWLVGALRLFEEIEEHMSTVRNILNRREG